MYFLHGAERIGVDIGERIPLLIGGSNVDIAHIEQQSAAGAPLHLGDEIGLGIGAFGESDVGGRIFQQHLATECFLHLVDM